MIKPLFALLLTVSLHSGGSELARLPAISSAVDKIFADLDRNDGPGCAIGYARAGKLIYEKQFGMANLEHNIGINSQTIFRIGSSSKQFVAASIAILSLQSKLDLDADIHTVLPDLPDYGTPVTIRQMISHSSGIADVYGIMGAVYGDTDGNFYPSEKTLEYIYRLNRLDFEPGTQYAYSNSAYLLLAQAVEKVSGQTMREFAHDNIFKPLGMQNSHFHDDHQELVNNRADGYSETGGVWQKNNTNFYVVGDGGVFSSVEDLVIWYNNFADNQLPGGDKLMKILTTPATYEEKQAKFRAWPMRYAFANMYLEFSGKTLFGHPGGFVGFISAPFRIQETDEIIVSLCNYRYKKNVNRVFDLVEKIYGDKK